MKPPAASECTAAKVSARADGFRASAESYRTTAHDFDGVVADEACTEQERKRAAGLAAVYRRIEAHRLELANALDRVARGQEPFAAEGTVSS